MSIGTKPCTNPDCKQVNPQPLTEFYKNNAIKSGLCSRCKSCASIRSHEWEIKNKERRKAQKVAEHEKYPNKRRERKKKYITKNRERVLEQHRTYYKENKENVDAFNYKYRHENPGKINAMTARRRAAKLQATPKWLTKEQKKEISALYIEAARLTRETEIKHHVDHILPLQGEGISGFHVPWNLQILTESENSRKHNQFDFTYDNLSWSLV